MKLNACEGKLKAFSYSKRKNLQLIRGKLDPEKTGTLRLKIEAFNSFRFNLKSKSCRHMYTFNTYM